MVGEVLDEAEGADINYLTDHARKIIAAAGGEPPGEEAPRVISRSKSDMSKAHSGDLSALRDWAASILLAQQAAKDKQVQSFRQEVLGGKLLEHSEVEGWIHEQANTDGPITWWIKIPVVVSLDGPIVTEMPRELRAEYGDIARWKMEDPRYPIPELKLEEWRYIDYSVPGVPWMRSQLATPRGILERLWNVSDHLNNPHYSSKCPAYPWNRGQATMFVLTGLYPQVRAMSSRVLDSPYLRGATRIVLTVDPAVSPAELAKRYQEVRTRVIPQRYRSLSAKHLLLAAFIAERPDEETWEQKRLEWNKQYPQYRYGQATNFRRDASRAITHLLNPKYETVW
jgi:hypothetical protein